METNGLTHNRVHTEIETIEHIDNEENEEIDNDEDEAGSEVSSVVDR